MTLKFNNRLSITPVEEGGSSGGTIESLNVTPSTSAQTITASGGVDGYSPVNVSAVTYSIDSNIQSRNIKSGVTILGITGTYSGSGVSVDSVIGQDPLSVYIEAFDDGTGQMTFSGYIDDTLNDIMYKITGKHFSTNYIIYDPSFTNKWVSDDNELELTVEGTLDLTTVVDEFSTTRLMYPVVYVMYGIFDNWSTGEKEKMIMLYNNESYLSGIVLGSSQITVQ